MRSTLRVVAWSPGPSVCPLSCTDELSAPTAFQAQWLAYAPAWFATDSDPDGPPAVIQLVASDELAVIELRSGQIHTRLGRATDPDLVLDGPPRAVLGLLSGVIDLERAGQLGLSVRGRRDLLTRLRPVAQDRALTQDEGRP